jgi:4-hydroxy 2-oxovalerate aldolase
MIVDTYGVLYPEGLEAITKVYGSKLNPSIRLGLHVHENLSSAFSLVQWFIKNMIGQRDVIVDGSLMGIGRAPGNLCTELISNYLNERYGKNIGLAKILQLIEEDIAPIKKKYKWGYSPEYFLSAKYKVHRSYAEYLSEANYKLERIDQILKRIDSAHATKFYKSYLEELIKKLTASDN